MMQAQKALLKFGLTVSLCFLTAAFVGCAAPSGGNGGGGNGGGGADGGDGNNNGGDNGGSGGDGGGGSSEPAIVKTNIIISLGGKIDLGDDLLVYGVGSDEDETTVFGRFNQPAGVHFITPSQAISTTDSGTMIPGSDLLFGHRDFEVAGKKVVLVRSTNAVSVYDTQSGDLVDIPPTEITLHPVPGEQDAPGQMTGDGLLVATINNTGFFGGTEVADGNPIKVIDVSGATPNVISLPVPDNFGANDVFDQVAVDAQSRRVAAVGGLEDELFVYDLDDPTAQPTMFDFGLGSPNGIISNDAQIQIDGDFVIFHDDSEIDPAVALIDISTGVVTRFTDNPTQRNSVVALAGGSFGYFLLREQADQEVEASSTNVLRSAIGGVSNTPGATLASQLDRFDPRSPSVDTGIISREQCLSGASKRIGYGASMCITPDGNRWFLGGWRGVDRLFDYIQMSTGGEFTDFADPEGSTLTGSLMGTDVVCSADAVAFRGLRETPDASCLTTEDWVIAFIVLDRLGN